MCSGPCILYAFQLTHHFVCKGTYPIKYLNWHLENNLNPVALEIYMRAWIAGTFVCYVLTTICSSNAHSIIIIILCSMLVKLLTISIRFILCVFVIVHILWIHVHMYESALSMYSAHSTSIEHTPSTRVIALDDGFSICFLQLSLSSASAS